MALGDPPLRQLAEEGLGQEASFELISSELLLDGSARLNLATFVTTWMPSSAERLSRTRIVQAAMALADEEPSGAITMRAVAGRLGVRSPMALYRYIANKNGLDDLLIGRTGHQDALESAVANYDMAYAMQSSVPKLMDISAESEACDAVIRGTGGGQHQDHRRILIAGDGLAELITVDAGKVAVDHVNRHGSPRGELGTGVDGYKRTVSQGETAGIRASPYIASSPGSAPCLVLASRVGFMLEGPPGEFGSRVDTEFGANAVRSDAHVLVAPGAGNRE